MQQPSKVSSIFSLTREHQRNRASFLLQYTIQITPPNPSLNKQKKNGPNLCKASWLSNLEGTLETSACPNDKYRSCRIHKHKHVAQLSLDITHRMSTLKTRKVCFRTVLKAIGSSLALGAVARQHDIVGALGAEKCLHQSLQDMKKQEEAAISSRVHLLNF